MTIRTQQVDDSLESDLTWQAIVGIGYEFDWDDPMLAYRHLGYDVESSFPLGDTNIGGPAPGVRIFLRGGEP